MKELKVHQRVRGAAEEALLDLQRLAGNLHGPELPMSQSGRPRGQTSEYKPISTDPKIQTREYRPIITDPRVQTPEYRPINTDPIVQT